VERNQFTRQRLQMDGDRLAALRRALRHPQHRTLRLLQGRGVQPHARQTVPVEQAPKSELAYAGFPAEPLKPGGSYL